MEYRDSFDIVLRDCRFILNAEQARRLLPGADAYLPPLSAIRFSDNEVPRFIWGFPVQHGRRLFVALNQLINEESLKCLSNPLYQENLRLLTPAQLQEDPYFKILSDILLKTLTENPALRLDSVLWIYLADVISRRLNQDENTARLFQEWSPQDALRFRNLDPELGRLRYKDPRRYADIRVRVLRSLFARNDFANSCMKEVFDEIPNNPLNREMIANRLIYTERGDQLYRTMDASDAFLVKGYRLTYSDFMAVHRVFRIIISQMLLRGAQNKLLPLDGWFLKTFVTDEVRQRAASLPNQGPGILEKAGSPQEIAEAEEREKIAWFLSMQENPCGYLFYHLPEADKEYFRLIEKQGTIPKEVIKALRTRATAVQLEPLYADVCRDLQRWDFFHALKSRIRWTQRQVDKPATEGPVQERMVCENRVVDPATVVVNLDSFYELYRRSRYGTAVFFDLIGFTDRTRALTRELKEAASRGDKDRYSLAAVSLGIQRVFSVRNQLQYFGGIPQGFEGDAILDIFPRAFDALRYVAAFSENYHKNRLIRFRPFERPTENPYYDGFRVGLSSGDYSLISIVGRSNELSAQKATERAVGHTINRASRLNSGKKGDAFLLGEDPDTLLQDAPDPMGIFRVKISKKNELNNNGIASFEETYQEIREQVKALNLPWYEPHSREGGMIAGRSPRLRNYDFEFMYEDTRLKCVFLIRRLNRKPELKGLEDETFVVYEYVLMDTATYHAFLEQDAAHTPVPRVAAGAGKLATVTTPAPAGNAEPLALDVASSYDWQDTVDNETTELRTQFGIGMNDLERGREAISAAIERHDALLKATHHPNREPATVSSSLAPWEQSTGKQPSPAPTARASVTLHDIEVEVHGAHGEEPGDGPGGFDLRASAPAHFDNTLVPPRTSRAGREAAAPWDDGAPGAGDVEAFRVGAGSTGATGTDGRPSPFLGGGASATSGGAAQAAKPLLGREKSPAAELDLRAGLQSPFLGDLSGEDDIPPPWEAQNTVPAARPRPMNPGDFVRSAHENRGPVDLTGATRPDALGLQATSSDSFLGGDADSEDAWQGSASGAGLSARGLGGLEARDDGPSHVLGIEDDEDSVDVVLPTAPLALDAAELDMDGLDDDDDLGSEDEDAALEASDEDDEAFEAEVSEDDEAEVFAGQGLDDEGEALADIDDGAAVPAGADDSALLGLSPLFFDWSGEAETHELLMELAAEIRDEARRGPGEPRPLPRLVAAADVRIPNGTLLRAVLQGYVYTVLLPLRRGELSRVVIGFQRGQALEHVHVYPSQSQGREPWNLEPVFTQFLEELALLEFRPASTSWPLSEVLASGLSPVPLDFLERIYLKLKAQGRI